MEGRHEGDLARRSLRCIDEDEDGIVVVSRSVSAHTRGARRRRQQQKQAALIDERAGGAHL